MVRRRGPRSTAAQKAEVWRRWRQGESLNAIGRALGRIPKMVRYEVARTGGIPPPARHRSRLALTLAERETISRGLARGTSLRQISRQRGFGPPRSAPSNFLLYFLDLREEDLAVDPKLHLVIVLAPATGNDCRTVELRHGSPRFERCPTVQVEPD